MDGRKIIVFSFLLAISVGRSRSQSTRVRLVGGSTPNEGRVEVYYNGAWGTVCDDRWSRTDASVVCRMLGYSGAVSAPGSAHFGRGTGRIWLDGVGCLGNENSLFDCYHRLWGYNDCSHFDDAGVVCGAPRCSCPQSPTNGYTTACTRPGRGSLVNYKCYFGYKLVGGDKTRRCLPSGHWSGFAPSCSQTSSTSTTYTSDPDTLSDLRLAKTIIALITTVPSLLFCVIIGIVGSLCAAGKCCSANARNRPRSTSALQQTRTAGNRQTQRLQNPQTIGITPLAMGREGENQEHVFTGPSSDLPSYVNVVCHPNEFEEVCPQDPSSPRGPLPSHSGPGEHPPSYSDRGSIGGSVGGSVGGCDD